MIKVLIMMLTISWQLTLVAFIMTPVSFLLNMLIVKNPHYLIYHSCIVK
ncbi:MAG: hypothetical protein Q8936_22010 [Bacillota bacterium]|nr:hypothetical protein [Bacillota bacterium]